MLYGHAAKKPSLSSIHFYLASKSFDSSSADPLLFRCSKFCFLRLLRPILLLVSVEMAASVGSSSPMLRPRRTFGCSSLDYSALRCSVHCGLCTGILICPRLGCLMFRHFARIPALAFRSTSPVRMVPAPTASLVLPRCILQPCSQTLRQRQLLNLPIDKPFFPCSFSLTKVIAEPSALARAVRPIRWM